MDWLSVAQAIPVGGHVKIEHDCGEGKCLAVFHNDTNYSAYCHRCGPQKRIFKALPTLEERAQKAAQAQEAYDAIAADTRPPQPAVYDLAEWPSEARLWLFKAGFSHEQIQRMGFYWHAPTSRVVVPVVVDGQLVYWQARRIFGTTGAKYLSMPGGRQKCVPVFGSGNSITLTEDLLSAIKIAEAGFRSLCLMGTSLLPKLWEFLINEDDIRIWLDPDAAGRSAAAEIASQLALVGKACRNVSSLKDPKLHSRAEIRALLAAP
jgi:hypothetical protein